MGERCPHFLPVDHPVVTIAHRAGCQARQVRAGAGLRVTDGNQQVAHENFRYQLALDPVVAVLGQHGADRLSGEEGKGVAGPHDLLDKNKLLQRRHAAPAPGLGPAHPDPAIAAHLPQRSPPQRAAALPHVALTFRDKFRRHQGSEIGAQFIAQRQLSVSELDVHAAPGVQAIDRRKSLLALVAPYYRAQGQND